MQEFSIWVHRSGTVRLMSIPETAHRPAYVQVFDSFAYVPQNCDTHRSNGVYPYKLVTGNPDNFSEVSERKWLADGFVCVGGWSFDIPLTAGEIMAAGKAFIATATEHAQSPFWMSLKVAVNGYGDMKVFNLLVRYLRDFDSVNRHLPDITLFSAPSAPAARYNF